MKSILIDTARFIFISLEAAVALFLFAIYLYSPSVFNPIGTLIASNDMKIVITLLGLPVAGLIYGYRFASDLTSPKDMNEGMKKKFFEWDCYPKLRNRAYFANSLCIVGLMVNIVLWLISTSLKTELSGLIYGIANAMWFVGIISLALANLSFKAILGGRR